MTREEFIARNIDELAGILLDVTFADRQGKEMSFAIRQNYRKLQAKLGAMYDQLVPPPPKGDATKETK